MPALITVALVVVDQVLAAAGLACIWWAIRDVATVTRAVILVQFLKAAIANAFVIIMVHTGRFLVVRARSVCTTFVPLAIVHVKAFQSSRKLTSGLAACSCRDRALHEAICAPPWIACEGSFVIEDQLCLSICLLAMIRNLGGTTLNWEASLAFLICAIILARNEELFGAGGLPIHGVATITLVVCFFFEDMVGTLRERRIHLGRRNTAPDRLRHLTFREGS
jgi:hypothetical protein